MEMGLTVAGETRREEHWRLSHRFLCGPWIWMNATIFCLVLVVACVPEGSIKETSINRAEHGTDSVGLLSSLWKQSKKIDKGEGGNEGKGV